MSDIHALSGAYTLDALDDLERANFERHLATCASCQAEVHSLRDGGAHLATLSATPPPPHLRARILSQAATARPLPPQAAPTTRPGRRRVLLIAAAAALIAGTATGITALWRPWEPDTVQLSQADRVRQAPDAQTWTQALPSGGRVTVTRSRNVGAALWETSGLAPAPAGRVHQLWLQAPDESLKPAGLLPAGDNGVILRGDAAAAIGAGLTEEPAGGSTAPTTEPLAFIDFRVEP